MPFKKTSFFPLYVEYVDEIFNPHPHPHIPHMRIMRIFRIFRKRMASPTSHPSNRPGGLYGQRDQDKRPLSTLRADALVKPT